MLKSIKYIIAILVFSTSNLFGQTNIYRIKQLDYEDGLTNSDVHDVCQDNQGFIWIATKGGVFRFDGFRMKNYKNILHDSTSLNSNFVFTLLNDSNGNLWIGTYNGVMLYNQEFDNFIDLNVSKHYFEGDAANIRMIYEVPGMGILATGKKGGIVIDPKLLKPDELKTKQLREVINKEKDVMSYLFSSDRNLWIGTLSGIYIWDLKSSTSKHVDLSTITGINESNYVIDILEDREGDVWISTRGGGVLRKKKSSTEFISYINDKNNPLTIGSNECYYLWIENSNRIWIATHGDGINVFDKKTETFSRLIINSQYKTSILNNNARAIFQDKQGNIWIGLRKGGLNILINNYNKFNHQAFRLKGGKEAQSVSINSFFLEKKDILWVGTDGEGLKKLNRRTGKVLSFNPNEKDINYFPDKVIMNIKQMEDGKLWMGTFLGGLIIFDPKTYSYKQYKHNPKDSSSISNNFVAVIQKDSYGQVWVGTNGGGLNLYDKQNDSFISFKHNPDDVENTLTNDYINIMNEDSKGHLWIGTYWGLSRFDLKNHTFKNYTVDNGLINNIIYSIIQDKKDRLWIGTQSGLMQYNYQSDTFTTYFDIAEISDCKTKGILEDDKGNLWITSDNGLFRFNPDTRNAYRYSIEDGLQGNEFYRNSCHKGFNGEFFIGGYKGFNSFFPDSIKEKFYQPEVIITNLSVLDKEIPIGKLEDGRTILKKNISITDKIKLKFSDKSFSLGFSAIDFIESNKNIYAYRLDNFDEDWNYSDVKYPFATYTNLSPGEYVFRIKAGRKEYIDQVSEEKTIEITITPPLWRTWLAYVIFLLIIAFIVFYFWKISIQRLKEKNTVKLEKIKREQSEKISQARLQFFMNISHEIRTPLTLIIDPLEQLLKKKQAQAFHTHFDIMLKSARRLLRLINQLLDLRKFELNKMKLKTEYADLSKFVKDIMFTFQDHAADKKIDFQFRSEPKSIMVWFDPDKMDKIVFNLLSNAFKYTKEQGKVSVHLKNNTELSDENYSYVELVVSDTGKGIKKEEIKHIFDRFYQGYTDDPDINHGSGLGLALTQSFVDVHKGRIEVKSAENIGSKFMVYIPNSDIHLAEDEKISNVKEPGLNKYIHIASESYIESKSQPIYNKATVNINQYQALIIEDNVDLRNYLMSELSIDYYCFEAADGKAGIEMAIDIMPDIIISDIMMPAMNGLEFCNKIKDNIITSHIPVILLTAKNSTEDQLAGYKSGADAYVSKPFVISNLKANMHSILENRRKVKERFSALPEQNSIKNANSIDDKFISLLDKKITQNLSNSQLSVEELAKDIGMSRAHLHRKMKAIINLGPNEYIRKIRVKKAAELLLQGELSISEVSVEVGFNSTSYFSSAFKSYFQVSPKVYLENTKLKN